MNKKINQLYNNSTKKDFKEFDSSYILTTENIKEYAPFVENEEVLTINSSGDHFFNFLALGAKGVDTFDINEFTKYILQLKKTSIEHFDIEKYKLFLGITDLRYILDYSMYLQINEFLDFKTREVWNYIYKLANYNGLNVYFSNLFIKPYMISNVICENEIYLDEKKYIELQNKLNKLKNFNFYHSDIENLYQCLDKKYDKIFLSNIQDYKDSLLYIKALLKLEPYLNDNGSIYFAYMYDYNSKRNVFDKLLENKGFSSKIITGMDSYYYTYSSKDKVYIYTKYV